MKKLFSILAFILVLCITEIMAQVPGVHNPTIQPTITKEQILSWSKDAEAASPGIIQLDFEGAGNLDEIGQFYNGGTSKSGFSGRNQGVVFSPNALSIIDSQHGGTGNFGSDIIPNTGLFFLTGNEIKITVNAGFSEGLTFYYASDVPGSIAVFEGPEGTGTMLASMAIQAVSQGSKGNPAGYFDSWKYLKLKFSGTARSVVFNSTADRCLLDDIVLGSTSVKGTGAGMTVVSEGGSSKSGFVGKLTTPQSQTMKGKLFLDGSSSLHFDIGSSKSKYDGEVDENSGYNYFDFNFMPKAGYFFFDNFVGGVFMDFEAYSNKSKQESGYSYKGLTFIIGPFVRYYVPVNDQFMPFAEVQFGGGVDNSKYQYSSSDEWSKSNETVITYRLGGGATYFFNNIVGCDLFLGYEHDAYKYKDSEDGERSTSSTSSSIYGQFTMQLGIVVVLDL